jgi:hypothetical protein
MDVLVQRNGGVLTYIVTFSTVYLGKPPDFSCPEGILQVAVFLVVVADVVPVVLIQGQGGVLALFNYCELVGYYVYLRASLLQSNGFELGGSDFIFQ